MKQRVSPAQAGFTVVELIVVMVISGALIGVITGFALNYWGKTLSLSNAQQVFVSRLNAGDYLRDGINSASGMIIQNGLPDNNVGNVDPGNGTGKYWLPIHALPSTILNGAGGTITPLLYYSRPSVNTTKTLIMNGSVPYEDNIVLYLNGTTKQLLARTIANPYAAANRAKTSCPAVSASTACPADIIVSENVASIGMRYFSRSGNIVDYTSVVDTTTNAYIGPDFPSVEIVEFSLNIYKKAQLKNANNTSSQTVIRVALRN